MRLGSASRILARKRLIRPVDRSSSPPYTTQYGLETLSPIPRLVLLPFPSAARAARLPSLSSVSGAICPFLSQHFQPAVFSNFQGVWRVLNRRVLCFLFFIFLFFHHLILVYF